MPNDAGELNNSQNNPSRPARTLYDTLGVGRDASQTTIVAALRESRESIDTATSLGLGPNYREAMLRTQSQLEGVLGTAEARALYDKGLLEGRTKTPEAASPTRRPVDPQPAISPNQQVPSVTGGNDPAIPGMIRDQSLRKGSTFYDQLGLPSSATQDQIDSRLSENAASFEEARRLGYGRDMATVAGQSFQELDRTMRDPARRAAYDAELSSRGLIPPSKPTAPAATGIVTPPDAQSGRPLAAGETNPAGNKALTPAQMDAIKPASKDQFKIAIAAAGFNKEADGSYGYYGDKAGAERAKQALDGLGVKSEVTNGGKVVKVTGEAVADFTKAQSEGEALAAKRGDAIRASAPSTSQSPSGKIGVDPVTLGANSAPQTKSPETKLTPPGTPANAFPQVERPIAGDPQRVADAARALRAQSAPNSSVVNNPNTPLEVGQRVTTGAVGEARAQIATYETPPAANRRDAIVSGARTASPSSSGAPAPAPAEPARLGINPNVSLKAGVVSSGVGIGAGARNIAEGIANGDNAQIAQGAVSVSGGATVAAISASAARGSLGAAKALPGVGAAVTAVDGVAGIVKPFVDNASQTKDIGTKVKESLGSTAGLVGGVAGAGIASTAVAGSGIVAGGGVAAVGTVAAVTTAGALAGAGATGAAFAGGYVVGSEFAERTGINAAVGRAADAQQQRDVAGINADPSLTYSTAGMAIDARARLEAGIRANPELGREIANFNDARSTAGNKGPLSAGERESLAALESKFTPGQINDLRTIQAFNIRQNQNGDYNGVGSTRDAIATIAPDLNRPNGNSIPQIPATQTLETGKEPATVPPTQVAQTQQRDQTPGLPPRGETDYLNAIDTRNRQQTAAAKPPETNQPQPNTNEVAAQIADAKKREENKKPDSPATGDTTTPQVASAQKSEPANPFGDKFKDIAKSLQAGGVREKIENSPNSTPQTEAKALASRGVKEGGEIPDGTNVRPTNAVDPQAMKSKDGPDLPA